MRKLGRNQIGCLRSMAGDLAGVSDSDGVWHSACGWLWDTVSRTERIMESLHRRGLVERVNLLTATGRLRRIEYRITDLGRQAVAEHHRKEGDTCH